jgi:hypothetical protein
VLVVLQMAEKRPLLDKIAVIGAELDQSTG